MTVDSSGIENSETFAGAETVSEEAWQAEIEKFDSIMTEWRSLLAAADESKIDEAVSARIRRLGVRSSRTSTLTTRITAGKSSF